MRSRTKLLLAGGIGVLMAVLYACENSDPTASGDSTIIVDADPRSVRIDSTGKGTSRIQALLLDKDGRPQSGIGLRFSTDSGSLRSNGSSVRTDSNGNAEDVLTLRRDDDDADVIARSGNKTASVTVSIEGRPAIPTVDFTALPTSGTAPLTVQFGDLSTQSPTSWAWDFQNDNSVDSTAQNPSFTYTTANTYSVTLKATNALGTGTKTKAGFITVTAPVPVVDFTGAPTSGPRPLTVQFTDMSTNNPTSWAWDFESDGTVDSILRNPSNIYNQTGTYSVTLKATNAAGTGTGMKSSYITVQ